MRDFIEIMGFMLVVVVLVFGGIGLAVDQWGRYTCGKYADVTGRETKWVFLSDCYINTGEEWMTYGEYKAVRIARDGLRAHLE